MSRTCMSVVMKTKKTTAFILQQREYLKYSDKNDENLPQPEEGTLVLLKISLHESVVS